MTAAKRKPRRRGGGENVSLRAHLESYTRDALRGVAAYWTQEAPRASRKRELVGALLPVMQEEGAVYRQVRGLTRRVHEVLHLLLGREGFSADLPGLFRRLPGEPALALDYPQAEAGLKALHERGFVTAHRQRHLSGNGHVRYSVPVEIGTILLRLLREEQRTVRSVFSLGGHLDALTVEERRLLAESCLPGQGAAAVASGGLGGEKLGSRRQALSQDLQGVLDLAIGAGGLLSRARWGRRTTLRQLRWGGRAWARAFEGAALGTVLRLSLEEFGLDFHDEALVVFREVLEEALPMAGVATPPPGRPLRLGCDFASDVTMLLDAVHRSPLRATRQGEVHRAERKRLESAFVSRPTPWTPPETLWDEVLTAARHLGLIEVSSEERLVLKPEADAFRRRSLEDKVRSLYRIALEQGGPKGLSLHSRELRLLASEVLSASPAAWWSPVSLAVVVRHRYFEALEVREIRERHRDRHFHAWRSGTQTPEDLLDALSIEWWPRLLRLGLIDAVETDQGIVALRLSPLGRRVLEVQIPSEATGVEPLVVTSDFEVHVLPEGDVSDVVHTLDAFAERVQSEDVVRYRLTRTRIRDAIAAGRSLPDFLAFLAARSAHALPQNVDYSVESWAGAVTFAGLEPGVIVTAESEEALDRILAVPGMEALLRRRLGRGVALLSSAPEDRALLAALRLQGIQLRA